MATITPSPFSPCTLDDLVTRAQGSPQTMSPLVMLGMKRKLDDPPLWMTRAVELNKHSGPAFLDDMRVFHRDSWSAGSRLDKPREMSTSVPLSPEDVETEIEMHGESAGDIYYGDSNNSIDTLHEADCKHEKYSTLTTEEERAIVKGANIKIEQILQKQDDLFDWTISSIRTLDPERATVLKELRAVANGRVSIFLQEQETPQKRRVLRIKFTRDRDERRIWTLDQQFNKPPISGVNQYAISRRFLKRSPDEEEETSDSAGEASTLPPSKRRRLVPPGVETISPVTNPLADGSSPQGTRSSNRHQLVSPFEQHFTTCLSPRIEDKLIGGLDKPVDEKSVSEEARDTSLLTPTWACQFINSPSLQVKRKSVHWAENSTDKTNVDQKNNAIPLKGQRLSLPRPMCMYALARDELIHTPTYLTDEVIIARDNNSRCSLLPPIHPDTHLPTKKERRDSGYQEIADKMDIDQVITTSPCLARTKRASAPPPPGRRSSTSSPRTSATSSRASTFPASSTNDKFELTGVAIPKDRRRLPLDHSQNNEKVYETSAGGQASDFLKHPSPPQTKNVDSYRAMLRRRIRRLRASADGSNVLPM